MLSLLPRPGRAAAVTGAVLAVGATAAMALVAGTAAADVPGRCTADVNVRSAPDPTAEVVGLCEEGTKVQVAEARNGFVRLPGLGGWSAAQYVATDGAPPAAPAPAQKPAPTPTAGDGTDDGGTEAGDTGVTEPTPTAERRRLPDAEVTLLF